MRWLLIILLGLVGFLYWYMAREYCCGPVEKISESKVMPPAAEIDTKKIQPVVGFNCSDDDPKLSDRWNSFRDSIITNLKDNQILEIKGLNYSDEKVRPGSSLALSRAQKVRALFKLGDDRIKVVEAKNTGNCAADRQHEMVVFNSLSNAVKIKKVDDRILIYFPSNSVSKLNFEEVETYLDDVISRVKASGERVRLTGHTDSDGDEATNIALGQRRADVIKNYLTSRGLAANKIISSSAGESKPVASNATEQGKAENRRTELQIIK